MIQNPLLLCLLFIGLAAGLSALSAHPASRKLFGILPIPFWCYFLPTLATTFGLLPPSHALYGFLSQQLLPVCLVLLLLGTDVRGLARMGPLAAFLMLAGSAGTILGGLVSFSLYRRWLPPEAWGAVGALTGSWIGGSANLLAVKEALRVPDPVIAPIILVDAGIAYSWMGLLIASAALQPRWNRWIRAAGPAAGSCRPLPCSDSPRPSTIQTQEDGSAELRAASGGISPASPAARIFGLPGETHPPARQLAAAIALAIALSLIAQRAAQALPAIGAAFSASTWTVLLVTTAAVGLSLTPLRRLDEAGLSKAGTFALYVLLASIGARANLQTLAQAPAFLLLGLTWIGIHGLCLLLVGWLTRAPLGLIATASQANIGGPISAPIVGGTFSKELAGIGLLMAVLGNLLGTPLGLAAAFAALRLP